MSTPNIPVSEGLDLLLQISHTQNMASQSTDKQPEPNIDVTNPYTPRRPSPIISISVNHPIGTALRKIKNFLTHKQTLFSTTLNIKVTPIVAIVSFFGVAALFGSGVTTAFNFGKTVEQRFLAAIPSPTPKIIVQQPPTTITTSRSGIIKATYQLAPTTTTPQIAPTIYPTVPSTKSLSETPSDSPKPTLRPTVTPTLIQSRPTPAILHYILVSRTGSITFLTSNQSIHLQNYLNLHVLISGSFDSTKNTLNVTKGEDIEILE